MVPDGERGGHLGGIDQARMSTFIVEVTEVDASARSHEGLHVDSAALPRRDTLSGESDQCAQREGGRGEPQERRQDPPPIHDMHSDAGGVISCTPPRSAPRPGPQARDGVPARGPPPRFAH
jgi:hypothetical protein